MRQGKERLTFEGPTDNYKTIFKPPMQKSASSTVGSPPRTTRPLT